MEHDKANKLGGDYAESTAISRWYADNVLAGIYRGRDDRIRWAYALDQWKPQFDDFVRRRDHERALKTRRRGRVRRRAGEQRHRTVGADGQPRPDRRELRLGARGLV